MAADPYATVAAGELERTTAPLAWIEKLGVRNQVVAGALRGLADAGRIRRAGRDGWVAAPAGP